MSITNLPSDVEVLDLNEVKMRFIELGHGGKCRKVLLFDDNDVQRMYEAHIYKK